MSVELNSITLGPFEYKSAKICQKQQQCNRKARCRFILLQHFILCLFKVYSCLQSKYNSLSRFNCNYITMNKGTNNPDSKKTCADHLFSLSPLKPSCYFQKVITSQFCENGGQNLDKDQGKYKAKKRNTKKKVQKQSCVTLNLPLFNKDNNYGSPGFTLSSEKTYYIQNFERILYEHQRHVQNIERNNAQICIPKPGSKNNFCSVCKQQYEEYISHIACESHKKKIKVNKFNDYIIELEDLMRKQNPLNSIPNSNSEKPNCHSLHTTTAEQHPWNQYNRQLNDKNEEKMMVGNPRKMIKMDPYFMPIPSYNLKDPNQNHNISRQSFLPWQQNVNPNFNPNFFPNSKFNSYQIQNQTQNIELPIINLNQTQSIMPPNFLNYNLHMNPIKQNQNLNSPPNGPLNQINTTHRQSSFLNQNSYNHNHQNISPPPSFYPLVPPQLSYASYYNYPQQGTGTHGANTQNHPLNCIVDPLINWNAQILMHQMVSAFHTIQNLQRIQMQVNNRFTMNMNPNLNQNLNTSNYPIHPFNMNLVAEDAIPELNLEKSQEKEEKNKPCQIQGVFQRGARAKPCIQGNVHRVTRNRRRKSEKSQNSQQKYPGTLNHNCFGREVRQNRDRSIIMEQEYEKYDE